MQRVDTLRGSTDSTAMEYEMVEWNSGMVEQWNMDLWRNERVTTMYGISGPIGMRTSIENMGWPRYETTCYWRTINMSLQLERMF